MNELLWVAILLLCISVVSTQYVDSAGTTHMSTMANAMLSLHVFITAFTSVWNMKVLKGSPVPLLHQNVLLYCYGIVLALFSYIWLEYPLDVIAARAANSSGQSAPGDGVDVRQKDFFEGYSVLATLLVLSQAFHGLVVAAVYKYVRMS